jgi:predicted RNase H-like HicB family nuclease
MSRSFPACIHSCDGRYWAEVPGFPGCVSEGDTPEETRANIREAFEGVFEMLQDDGAPPDEPGTRDEINV